MNLYSVNSMELDTFYNGFRPAELGATEVLYTVLDLIVLLMISYIVSCLKNYSINTREEMLMKTKIKNGFDITIAILNIVETVGANHLSEALLA